MADKTADEMESWAFAQGYQIDVDAKENGTWWVTLSHAQSATHPRTSFAASASERNVQPGTAYVRALRQAHAKAIAYEDR